MMMYFVTVQASTQEYQNQIARLAVQYDMQHTRGDTKAIGGVFKYQYTGTNVRMLLYASFAKHSVRESVSPKHGSKVDKVFAELSRDLTNALNRK